MLNCFLLNEQCGTLKRTSWLIDTDGDDYFPSLKANSTPYYLIQHQSPNTKGLENFIATGKNKRPFHEKGSKDELDRFIFHTCAVSSAFGAAAKAAGCATSPSVTISGLGNGVGAIVSVAS